MRFLRLLVLCLCLNTQPARAAEDSLQLQAQEIKVGLLYNFLKYTQRLDSTSEQDKITVCLFGNDPIKPYLQPMAGRTVNQREIVVRAVRNIRDAEHCHLLFIGNGEKKHWPEMRNFLAGKSVLTVSDSDDFTDSGGMIEFGRKDNHISVNLNMDALTAAGLRVQDRLLRLVTVVHAKGDRS